MKANQMVKPVINMESGLIEFIVKGHPTLTLDMNKVHPDNQRRASFVGMAQTRIVDRAAVGRADAKGNIIPEATRQALKHERMASLIAHYESGSPDWSVRGEAGFRGGMLFQCLCAMQPERDPEQIRKWLGGLDDATKAKLLSSEKIKPIRESIEKARAGDTSEAEEALDEFLNV